MVPRYQRRTGRVDEALLGVYISGTNGRRIRSALAPLLKGAPLSKDAVSRLTGRLAGDFAAWRHRDLAAEQIRYLFLDGWYPKVRLGKQRVRVPVLITLGVCADGRRLALDMRMADGRKRRRVAGGRRESRGPTHRRAGALAIIDGTPGLPAALRTAWPTIEGQRCTAHKLRNLQAKAPARWREELTEDYRRMIYADRAAAVQKARGSFTKKWRMRCPAVVASLEEAGEELFTFVRFPVAQWKALRPDQRLERINEEFRRRVKTQGSLPSQDAVMLLMFGLLRSGQIKLARTGRISRYGQGDGATGGVITRRIDANLLFHHLTDTTDLGSRTDGGFMRKQTVLATALTIVLAFALQVSGQSEVLTNADVMRMMEAKLTDDLIVSKIKASTCSCDTSVDAILKLKNAGVSDTVIQAMVTATRVGKSATSGLY